MGIQFHAIADIAHINIRRAKQGRGDDEGITAIDVKLQAEIPGESLASALGAENAGAALTHLWDFSSEDRDPMFAGIDDIKLWAEFEDHEINFASHRVPRAKIGKISFKPIAHAQAAAQFTITVDDPPDALVNLLVDRIKTTIRVAVEPPRDLFEGQAAG